MNRIASLLIAVVAQAGAVSYVVPTSGQANDKASPIYGVKIPAGYRDWKVIAVDHLQVAGKADQLRAQLGCTRPALPATRLRKIATMSSPTTHLSGFPRVIYCAWREAW